MKDSVYEKSVLVYAMFKILEDYAMLFLRKSMAHRAILDIFLTF